jgi:hypothetical protein
MPELQELLWQAVQFGNDATVRTAVGLWLEEPSTRDERVGRILTLDSSTAVLEPVLSVLTRRRTDLLDEILGRTAPHGRFLYRDSHWLPPVGRHVDRWLPRQQAAAARLLTRAMGDASLRPDQRIAAIRQGALIPELGAAAVRRWTDSPDVLLAEAALAALAGTDRPGEALSTLLERGGDDRARVAVHAVTRAARYVEPSRLAGILRSVLLPEDTSHVARVTSRTEVARIAAALLSVPVAAALVAEACAQPGQHPDVRAACLSVAPRLLGDERAWQMIVSATSGPPALRRTLLRTRPLDLPERHRQRYARLATRICDTEDREVAEAGYAALAHWAPWSPEAAAALAAAVTDLEHRRTWRAAADGLVGLATTVPGTFPALGDALTALVTAEARTDAADDPGAPAVDAGTDRDRPARRRVEHLVERLAVRAVMRPDSARQVAVEAGEVLARHDGFVPGAARLLTDALDLDDDPAAVGEQLSRLARLHEGRPALAERTAAALSRRLGTARRPGTDAALSAAASRLAEEGTQASGLLATTLTTEGGRRTDWPEPWRALLRSLRRHPVPDVRDAALAVRTAEE